MSREQGVSMLARARAVVGLAAVMTIGAVGGAQAAPADRADDAVVLKGADLPTLVKGAPDRIAAFKWSGKWQQVPVQVDERHVVSVRDLYPEELETPVYVPGELSFDLEVYADAKTRSGADKDKTFDANDELVFMAGDSGGTAPKSAPAPKGMVPSSATRLKVADPVGGGDAYVYLFKSSGKVDQSAGRDYVKYDFKLTELGAGENVRDNYRYQNSPNPEDSKVTTANYELHSVDRWMEDEIRVKAGGATGADILDREAVSAGGLGGCSRSEYTFSGNWHLDIKPSNDRPSDQDEGTYVAIKDGPVRAIRTFMGANSGPYVEKIHRYYRSSEDITINLRVHPMPDMYVWTDLSEEGLGMTFRDDKNQSGVPVDGARDTLVPHTNADFTDGKYSWQQVSGAQGSLTTMTRTINDLPSPNFTSYQLDATDPNNSNELQCGGDLKAIGAHGFGMVGFVPNTDPNLGISIAANNVRVDRMRYFGSPTAGAADAENLTERVSKPLVVTAAKSPMKAAAAKLKAKVLTAKVKGMAGKTAKVRVKVTNAGNADSRRGKVCVKSRPAGFSACSQVKALRPGKSATVTVKGKIKGKKLARGGKVTASVK